VSNDPQVGAQDPIEAISVTNVSNKQRPRQPRDRSLRAERGTAARGLLSRGQLARAWDSVRQHHRPSRRSTRW
jgi:hypothetical protein